MNRRNLAIGSVVGVLALGLGALEIPTAVADSKGPWIHVEVLENGGEGASVKVNLPLSLARTVLNMAPDDVLSEGHIQIKEHCELSVAQIRELWKELEEVGDAEFVTIKDKEEVVRVFRKGDRLFVHVDGNNKEKVRVEVPVALVTALLSGPEDELDFEAALDELMKMDHGDIVRVEDGNDLVRVWIE